MHAHETPGVKFPPPFLIVLALFGGLALDRAWPLGEAMPLPPRLAMGIPLLALGLGLDLWALLTLRKARTTVLPWAASSALVMRGPYRVSRNPIYLGYALDGAAVALLFGSWWAWPLLVVAIVLLDVLVIRREERYLSARFGAPYGAYRARVRRWI